MATAGKLFSAVDAVFLIELVDPAVSPGHLLHSGVEGMAFGANFHFDLFLCGTGCKGISAVTSYFCLIVCRLNFLIHNFTFRFLFQP